ncbi:MAG: Beta sliding clamp [Chlamydiia bacterium]|nr:Beta sliding clamp [Chlamydiia bacterium]
MKVTIDRAKLVSSIGKIQNVVPSKAVIPVLSNILLEAKGDQLTLSSTDLTVSMQATVPASVSEEGAITLPARRFFQLIRELTTNEVEIRTTKDGIALIASGTSNFRLHGMDKLEFPTFPDLTEQQFLDVESAMLKEMLSNTAFAAAKDDSRQVLNGVFMKITDGELTLVGTDGKRLAKVFNKIDSMAGTDLQCIIPLKAVEEMIRILDLDENAKVTIMHDKIALEADCITLISKLLTGEFPDFERVIPDHDAMTRISLHREELSTLLKQVSLFTSEMNHSVKLIFEDGSLELQATNSDIGEGKVSMPVDYAKEKMEIAFNPQYFLDIIRHCKDETIDFGILDSFNPGSVSEKGQSHFVLMPMRLGQEA